ncbi:hypothetical protein PICMEDRAFT_73558 [Pichia membranifaciens NRRL Y-2026]|uniref:Uncharacterized protein n=1 Tax=Pichia membranifaciens NRRL Y-2026 TaxID=763406 RepID=A0A1E3NIW7_9ASCO|nr:hypothetical protein PICMEDRAFT_73558 [Pichia membranifaciens NRRL Y-2026]ODQ46082.1 hypothetical protein PICMEDRAFT_73558 [Pichia membranifaciens NRRL Y-2026]
MSAPGSPKRIAKKQSLSILSGSTLNQINNQHTDFSKPVKERIISESTGLIKFSLKTTPTDETANKANGLVKTRGPTAFGKPPIMEDNTSSVDTLVEKENNPEPTFTKIPIYIPINKDEIGKKDDESQLLFKLASQQRKVLDLSEQLKQAKENLAQLEQQYKGSVMGDMNSKKPKVAKPEQTDVLSSKMISSPTKVASSLRKSASIININPPKINAQEQIFKTQKQVAETFTQLTTNISSNSFLLKSRSFFETNLNKNIQMGSELFNSIFEKDVKPEADSDTEVSVDEDTHRFDYSLDFDLDRLNKLNFDSKIKGTILEDLEEVESAERGADDASDHQVSRTLSAVSSNTEEDYGGAVTNM